jgi:hypothetical protein
VERTAQTLADAIEAYLKKKKSVVFTCEDEVEALAVTQEMQSRGHQAVVGKALVWREKQFEFVHTSDITRRE